LPCSFEQGQLIGPPFKKNSGLKLIFVFFEKISRKRLKNYNFAPKITQQHYIHEAVKNYEVHYQPGKPIAREVFAGDWQSGPPHP
jgi:type IV secretory pathway VirB9-like protein